jgi:hypothetical protein
MTLCARLTARQLQRDSALQNDILKCRMNYSVNVGSIALIGCNSDDLPIVLALENLSKRQRSFFFEHIS